MKAFIIFLILPCANGINLIHSMNALLEGTKKNGKGGCPFATIGAGFAQNGASPMYTQMTVKELQSVSQCDEFGNCTLLSSGKRKPKNGMQSLQAASNMTNGVYLPSANSDGSQVCMDMPALLKNTSFKSCKEASLAFGGCNNVTGACDLTCNVCSPVFISQYGMRSGTPYDIYNDGDELAKGAPWYTPPLQRTKCKNPTDLDLLVNFTRQIFSMGFADAPSTLRMGFHDCGDFNKWSAQGGCDGNFATYGEAWYGQSRSVNQGLNCVNQLQGKYSVSNGDAVQLCAIIAVEFSQGPKFEDFNFTLGRQAPINVVTADGLLPNPHGNSHMLQDYFFRMDLNSKDIVALMGGHTLGGGNGMTGSGFTGTFTPDSATFDNSYFKQLLNTTCQSYFTMPPVDRGMGGGCHIENGSLQLPTDVAMMNDPDMKNWVEKFAADEALFFMEFAKSYSKMAELGKDYSVQWCDV